MNSDRLYSQRPEAAAEGAIAAVNGVQNLPPEAQVIGLATAFKHATDVLMLDRAQLLHAVERMEADCRFRNANTLDAVRRYIEGELSKP